MRRGAGRGAPRHNNETRMKNILIAAVILIAFGVGGFMAVRYTRQISRQITAAPKNGAKPSVKFVKNPVAVPDLTLKTLDGRTINSREWKGKVTLVNFWATWC